MNCWILVLLLFCCGNNRNSEGSCVCNDNNRSRKRGCDSCNVVSDSVCRRERNDCRECDRDNLCSRERDCDKERGNECECDCQRTNSRIEPRLEPRQFISYQTNRDCDCE